MIEALIAGRLFGKPTERTAKNGSRFVTAKMRVPTRDGTAQFVNVVAFSQTAITTLSALTDGDAVALVGELSAKAYLNKEGEPAPSLDLLTHQVLTPYGVKRKRDAVRDPQPTYQPLPFDDQIPEKGEAVERLTGMAR